MATSEELVEALRSSLKENENLRRENADLVEAAREPIAIVGMACRYPGGIEDADELWNSVVEGRDGISPLPADRGWDAFARIFGMEAVLSASGGFLTAATEFDAGFFGISPREAAAMSPQQRMLLEVSWAALEHARIDPDAARRTTTGVFTGLMGEDYGIPILLSDEDLGGYISTGTTPAVASGRISYALGLTGPSLTVDTACSSSLVAVHLAAQALRRGDCALALAGGVSVMSTPSSFNEFARQGGLAEGGRCRSFAAAADGTAWAEGVGVLVLERLSEARRNGHRVLAMVRGSAVNQDGASNGLTAPNGPSQERVIRAALADAGLSTKDIDVVEAHGTGTRLGDPIEAQALLATYGRDRDTDAPLWLGSIKSNFGHAQAAAGVAGIIKMVQAVRHGLLPRTLHVDQPTPQVDWSPGTVQLLTESRPWPDVGRPRRAAVSSFGLSGTNSHVIIEAAPEPDAPQDTSEPAPAGAPALPWVLSAKSPAALRAQAARLRDHLTERPRLSAADVGLSLATTRGHFEHRAAVTATGRDALLSALDDVAEGRQPAGGATGGGPPTGRLAFLLSGQGSQRLGMGRELAEAFPVFADAFTEVLAALDEHLDRPLREVLWGDDERLLNQTTYTQPGLFAVEVALYRLFRSWGVRPDVLAGHSIGELAAAHIAGILSLADAAKLVTARARLMQALPAGGAMVAVQATEAEVVPLLTGDVGIAAVNGPMSVVVSGPEQSVLDIATTVAEQGRKTSRLAVSHAFHSPLMQPMLAEFARVAAGLSYADPAIPIVSTVTGGTAEMSTPEYWIRNVAQTVRFADAVRTLEADGVRTLVELGPDAVLAAMGPENLVDAESATFLATQRRKHPGDRTAVEALAALHCEGRPVDWPAFFTPHGASVVDLPTYAFTRKRYWLEPADGRVAAAADPTTDAFWQLVDGGEASALAEHLQVDAEALAAVLPGLSSWRRDWRERSTVDSWRYRIAWDRLADPKSVSLPGRWLVAGAGDTLDAVAAGLAEHGADVLRVEIDTPQRGVIARALRTVVADVDLAGVVSLLALDGDPCAATIPLVQALGDLEVSAPLWCVTTGGVTVGAADVPPDPAQAAVWGMGTVLALDLPQRWGGLVDLPDTDPAAIRLLCAALSRADEDQLAVRSGAILARRMAPAPADPAAPRTPWQPRGTVLVTGGTGGIGAHLARWLAENGAEHLVLTSRRGADAPGAAELTEELTALGARVTVAACDVADRDALAALLGSVPADRPLTAVLHAASALPVPVPLAGTTVADFTETGRAKIDGARHLDELTADADLDAFVLFSSGAAIWGSGHQAAYGAANAYVDALAHRRRAAGRVATSVAWGAWGGDTMAAEGDLSRFGLDAMEPRLAVEALRQAVEEGHPNLVVSAIDWAKFVPTYTMARPRPLLRGVPAAVAALAAESTVEPDAAADSLVNELATLSEADQERELLGLVRERAAAVLRHDTTDEVPPNAAFRELGFDSLAAVELRNQLIAATGLTLPATLVFDHPNPTDLAAFLRSRLGLAGDTADSTMSTLDKLEQALAGLSAHEIERTRIVARLQALVGELNDRTLRDKASEGQVTSVVDKLKSASKEALLAFIDDLGVA